MISRSEAVYIANKLNVTFDKFSLDDFTRGLNIELEHGLIDISTNITSNNLEQTAKIVLAHLNKYSNYYNSSYGLSAFENMIKRKLSE